MINRNFIHTQYIVCFLLIIFVGVTQVIAQDTKIIAQKTLLMALDKVATSKHEYFVKDKPIAIYEYNGVQSLIPEVIATNLGIIDQTKYSAKYVSKNAIIALQFNALKPDFYIIDQGIFTKQYKLVSLLDVASKNSKLFHSLKQNDDIAKLIYQKDQRLKGAIKLVTVKMVRVSAVYGKKSKSQSLVIQAPWGGTQTKAANKDAYFVIGDSEAYIVNLDDSKLPIGYIRHNKIHK